MNLHKHQLYEER